MTSVGISATLIVASTVFAIACGGGNGSTQPPAPEPVGSVTVDGNSSTIVAGATTQLSATLRGASGSVLTGRGIAWTSSNADVATVSGSGLVAGVAPGSTVIMATSEGKAGSFAVAVTPAPVASVTVTAPNQTMDVGQTLQVTAIARDAAGSPLPGRAVAYRSSAPQVASVGATGQVTGLGAGVATITAEIEGRIGSMDLRVMVPYESGGSNYATYSLGTYLTTPNEEAWYQPRNLRPVVGTYHWDSIMVKQQLATMFANGQRKIALDLWFADFTGDLRINDSLVYGHVVNSRFARLMPQHETNLESVIAAIRNAGFNQLVVRFASQGASDPWNWQQWNETQYANSRAFILTTIQQIERDRGGLPALYDLDMEKGGVNQGQGREYQRRLWKDYVTQFAASRSMGFSIAGSGGGASTLGATRLRAMLDDLDAAGARPGAYGVDIYGLEFETLSNVLQALTTVGEEHKPFVFAEGYYNDPQVASAIRRARAELRMNIAFILQWPLDRSATAAHFSMHYAPNFSEYGPRAAGVVVGRREISTAASRHAADYGRLALRKAWADGMSRR